MPVTATVQTNGGQVGNPINGTAPVTWTAVFTWATDGTALNMDIAFDKHTSDGDQPAHMLGDFWLKLQEVAGTPANVTDIDVQLRPLMRNAAGTLAVTEQALVMLEEAADFSSGSGSRLQGYSLNTFFALNGTAKLYLGGDGLRITLDPANAATVAIINAELIAR